MSSSRDRRTQAIQDSRHPVLARAPAHSLVALALVIIAVGIRVDGITAPPLDGSHYPSSAVVIRQYHSALLARAYFLDWRSSSSASDKRLAAGIRDDETLVEPPLIEALAAATYAVTGRERLWVPRLTVALVWVVGGMLLFLIAGRVTSTTGALVALAFYLFVPFGIIGGRSFQPDPLMVTLTLAASLLALRYADCPTRQRFGLAAASGAIASLVKPAWSLFYLIPIFLWHAVARHSFRWAVPRTVAYAVIAGLPTAAWIAYGLIVRDFLRGQASDKFQLEVFSHASTWRGWVSMSGEVLDPAPWLDDYSGKLGVIVLGLGIFCTAASSRSAQRILISLWVGYVLFGITFITHTATHNYYSLMLIPIVALAVGAALPRVSAALARPYLGERHIAAATTLALVAGALALHGDLAADSYPRTAATYARIGDLIGHRSAIVLAHDFGEPLEYHGGFRSRSWPFPDNIPAAERGVTVAARLAPANRTLWPAPGDMNPAPSFFVADSSLLGPQPELRRYLDALPLVGYVNDFRIYRLRG